MYDPDLTIAEIHGMTAVLRHHLRHALKEGDILTLRAMLGTIETQGFEIRSAIKKMELGDWYVWCECGFQGEPRIGWRKCPVCREPVRFRRII